MRHVLTATVVAALSVAPAALAGSVTFNGTVNGLSKGLKVVGSTTSVREALGNKNSINVQAGLMSWDLSGLGGTGDYEMLCIELIQHVRSGQSYHDYSLNDTAAAPIPGNAIGNEIADAIGRLFAYGRSSVDSAWAGAAFQAVVWEAIHDGLDNMNYASGAISFRKTNNSSFSGSTTFAQKFNEFAGLMMNTNLGLGGPTFAISSLTAQDQVGFGDGPGFVSSIPLPGAATLGTAGLALVGTRRRR